MHPDINSINKLIACELVLAPTANATGLFVSYFVDNKLLIYLTLIERVIHSEYVLGEEENQQYEYCLV
jgi:hypothetical protein